MLLIVTDREDWTADWLILELEARGARFRRFNTEDYPEHARLTWSPDRGVLDFDGRSVETGEVTAVWYRRPAPPHIPAGRSEIATMWAAREAAAALVGVWRTLPGALWVNHPDKNRLAGAKQEQLVVAQGLGFEVPRTLVTNDRLAALAFLDAAPAEVICKPLWDGRIPVDDGHERLFFTSVVSPRLVEGALGLEPYLFQDRVEKLYDVRVTVIGKEVFAARICSQESADTRVDWRRGDPRLLQHEPEVLPDRIAELCVDLCRHYELQFGAIDLARRPDGSYSFFEINPNGQWAWIQQQTGLPLREALADLLLADRRDGG